MFSRLTPAFQLRLVCFTRNLLADEVLEKNDLASANFLPRAIDAFTRFPLPIRFAVIFFLWFLDYEGWLWGFTRFAKMPESRQRTFFAARYAHPKNYFRLTMLRALQAFCLSVYYSDPGVAKSLGYEENSGALQPRQKNLSGLLAQPETDLEITVDCVVIGSGAGGAVVAKELAEQGREVLILEEGGYFRTDDFKAANSYERYIGMYRDAGFMTTIGIPPIVLPLGKTVGGTTTINSGTCFRLPNEVLAKWRSEHGLEDLTPEALHPYFARVETVLGVGPVQPESAGGNYSIVERGMRALSLDGGPLIRNAPGCVGAGECCFGCPTGAKSAMGESYIPRAFAAGAKLQAFCRVESLTHKNGKVTQIEAVILDPMTHKPASKFRVNAKTVIVACGTLLTPSLLTRSGIATESGALGRHLTIHPTSKVVGVFDEIIDGHKGVPQSYQTDFLHDQGVMLETVFYPPWLMAVNFAAIREEHARLMAQYRHIGIFGFLISDGGNGRVYTLPNGKTLIRYRIGEKEYQSYLEGLRWLSRILFAAGAKEVYPSVHALGKLTHESQISRINPYNVKRRDLESVAFHPLGTCRMGNDPKTSVVDHNLQVHGFENLFIADGSVFPSSLGVNPQETIMAFATRLGDFLSRKQ
jgi:choline dehydrogenase-like flavoprotein